MRPIILDCPRLVTLGHGQMCLHFESDTGLFSTKGGDSDQSPKSPLFL